MKKQGFTLAEILITLVIIGVIAALTIPTLMNSTADKEYVAASKRILATVAEAGRQMAVEDDIKRYKNVTDFVENGLSKRIDINKYCAPTGQGSKQTTGVPTDCGFAKNYTTSDGTLVDSISFNTNLTKTQLGVSWLWNNQETPTGDSIKSYSFQMSNGYSVLLFYNRRCAQHNDNWKIVSETNNIAPRFMCMSGVYDMNGKKGPNQVGRDMGFFSVEGAGLSSMASVALPLTEYGIYKNGSTTGGEYSTWTEAVKFCEDKQSMLPSLEEIGSMAMAWQLAIPSADILWSGSPATDNRMWVHGLGGGGGRGGREAHAQNLTSAVLCVRK